MADIERTFEVPNRVPGKLVFGPKRVLATYGSTETATPASLPPTLCPPAAPGGIGDSQSLANIQISIDATKESLAFTSFGGADNLSIGTSRELIAFTSFGSVSNLSIGSSKVVEGFPSVAGNAQSNQGTASTSHTVSLPGSIASGETLLVFMSFDGLFSTVSFPAGWTVIRSLNSNPSAAIAWRKADGTEGASITVTTGGSLESIHTSYRITGAADPTVQPPEVGGDVSGSDTTPNPGSFTPSAGGAAFLWIAWVAVDGAGPITAIPSGYGNNQSHSIAPVTIGLGDLAKHEATENPGNFTKTGSAAYRAGVVAVYGG